MSLGLGWAVDVVARPVPISLVSFSPGVEVAPTTPAGPHDVMSWAALKRCKPPYCCVHF